MRQTNLRWAMVGIAMLALVLALVVQGRQAAVREAGLRAEIAGLRAQVAQRHLTINGEPVVFPSAVPSTNMSDH